MDTTKENIMAVALRLFAEKGLKLVTVREICKAANVNVALVNYYFRNKNGLYQACVERLFHENTGDELCKIDANVSDARSWREAVRGWIFGVSRALRATQGGTALAAGFFRQEMVNPSPMCNLVRERYVIPVQNSLMRLIAMAVDDVHEQCRWANSIWSQLCANVLRDSSWNPLFRPKNVEAETWSDSVAEFIYRQVVSGMKYCAKRMLLFALAMGILTGCTNPDAAYREDAAQAFKTNLIAETERVLADAGGELALSNALEIAHARSLKLAQQDLETKLARINRATVFSAFLPTVGLSASGFAVDGGIYDVPNFGDLKSNRLQAKSASLMVAQPVFTPVAWVMFAESQYGVRIKDIVRERAVQLLDVQVAALFYQTAVAERRVETAARQLESARALTNRVMRLASEGYALQADAARAKARCVLAETSLDAARDDAVAAREELAGLLNLWPLAKFKVSGKSLLALPPLPEKSVEEWVWDGLISRKDLAAGDQTLELRKAQVIEALAGFLPNVVLGGGGMYGSIEDVAVRGWAGSLMGTWAIFEGFRNVQQYRAARATRETEFKLQEERMTAVVIAVADSWRQRRLVRQKAAAARAWAEAARLDYEAATRRYDDGNETLSSVLDKLAVSEDAETKLAESAYGEAMSDILLRQAVGIDVIEKEKK